MGAQTTTWPTASVSHESRSPARLKAISAANPKASAGSSSGDMNNASSARAQRERLRATPSAPSVPRTAEADVATRATQRLFSAARWSCPAPARARYQRKDSPSGGNLSDADAVDDVRSTITVGATRTTTATVESAPTARRKDSASKSKRRRSAMDEGSSAASRRVDEDHDEQHGEHEHDRDGGRERPVVGARRLLVHEERYPDQASAADERLGHEGRHARGVDEDASGGDAGQAERRDHARKRPPLPGAQRRRRVGEVRIDPPERCEQRQDHERQLHLGQHHHDARLGEEQPNRLVDQPDREQRLVEDALAAEDHDPGKRAHDDAGQERQDHGEDKERLHPRASPRDHPREWIAEEEANQRRLDAEDERVDEDPEVQAIAEEARVLAQRQRLHGRLGEQAHHEQHAERRQEEEREERGDRQRQPN